MSRWSVSLRSDSCARCCITAHHRLATAEEIIDENQIQRQLEDTKPLARDPVAVRDILSKARDRALLKHIKVSRGP